MDIETLFQRIRRGYQKNKPDWNALRKGYFPDFVTNGKISTIIDYVPVFTFHFVKPSSFEAQLQFLSVNGYRTIDPNHFYAILIGEKPVPERAVLLTFDDGWGSLWRYAYPLLKKYRMQAVAFIIPGLITEKVTNRPNLEDVWSGAVDSSVLAEGNTTDERLCSWHEIQAMSDSGVLNFQSHTMHHSQVFVADRLIDFYHPKFDNSPANLNMPNFHNSDTDCDLTREPAWGMPLYAYAPRAAGKRRYYDDERIRKACVDHVRKNGREKFFKSRGWRRELRRVLAHARGVGTDNGRFESEENMREAIYQDLLDSRRTIEAKLSGHNVTHLCYPYYVGSDLAVEVSRQAGYVANYWGFVEGCNANRPGDDPFRIVRIDERFLFRLPGQGRKTLSRILVSNLTRDSGQFLRRLRSSERGHSVYSTES